MDQDNDKENYEEEPEEMEAIESSDQITVAPPLEGPIAKYMREYRLLNSLLISLASILAFLWPCGTLWSMSQPAVKEIQTFLTQAAPAQQQQEKQKGRETDAPTKAQPKSQQTFRTTAISDITLPDMNELDVKDLAPVVEAAALSMADAGMNNDAMKSALKGIGLTLPQNHAATLRPQKENWSPTPRRGKGYDRGRDHERPELAQKQPRSRRRLG